MTAFPVGSVIIDIGDVPQWFIAIAAAGVLYKVWKSEKNTDATLVKIEQVRHETNSMRSALELASKAEGRLEGRQEMRVEALAAKETAKGVIRADAVADAQTKAAVRAADPEAPINNPAAIALTIAAKPEPGPHGGSK